MAVHVPLSSFAQAEARIQMLSAHNLLSPASGEPLAKPSRDIILGLYYITQVRKEKKGAGLEFATPEEALAAHERGEVALNAPIKVAGRETSVGRLKYVFANPDEALLAVAHGIVDLQDVVTVRYMGKRLETSPGRILFARIVAEAVEDEKVAWELIQLDVPQEKNSLKDLVYQAFLRLGMEKTARLLDALKYYGFTFSTTSGITIGIDDAVIPEEKKQYLEEADRKLLQIEQAYEMGFLTDRERYDQILQLWTETTEKVTQAVFKNFEENYPFNPLYVMAQSGARGNPQQIRQLCGLRGLMQKPSGETFEVPVRSSFREGLTVLEYFISSHGARKGGADTALRTADSGYLTRKLVDVTHEIVVREADCGTTNYISVPLFQPDEVTRSLRLRKRADIEAGLYGRVLAREVEVLGCASRRAATSPWTTSTSSSRPPRPGRSRRCPSAAPSPARPATGSARSATGTTSPWPGPSPSARRWASWPPSPSASPAPSSPCAPSTRAAWPGPRTSPRVCPASLSSLRPGAPRPRR